MKFFGKDLEFLAPAWARKPTSGRAAPIGLRPTSAAAEGQPEGFSRIGEYLESDIFVVGYPKSGNTWVGALLAGAVYGLDVRRTPDSLIRDLVPSVHKPRFFRRHGAPMFYKSHALPEPAAKRVIYLLRDGRDVMVSYRHFLRALYPDTGDWSRMISSGKMFFPCKWHDHVRQWLANPFQCDMIVVRYEDLKRDAAGELGRMCEFAQLDRSRAELERAVENASFENLQQRERVLGWESKEWPKDKMFVRRGAVGSHRDEMPPEVLELFLREAGEVMALAGYPVGNN